MPKKKRISFKKFCHLYPVEETPESDFCEDIRRDGKKFCLRHNDWDLVYSYLRLVHACPQAIEAAKNVFKLWEKKYGEIDGMTEKDVMQLRAATRNVWSWSIPRRKCRARASRDDDMFQCEKCQKLVPQIFVDHIIPVGKLDHGFFSRLYCSSKGLQALCKRCHQLKTNGERRELSHQRKLDAYLA